MAHIETIKTFRPARNDQIFVDTNVWLYLTFAAMQQGRRKKKGGAYSEFIGSCVNASAALYYSQAVVVELMHSIEQVLFEAYAEKYGELKKKQFRAIPEQRKIVMDEIDVIIDQVEALGTLAALDLNAASVARSRTLLRRSSLDGYDVLHVEAMRQHRISTVLTDDRDFATVENIIVVTDEVP